MELMQKIMGWVKKYRFVVLILLVGIGLMVIPFGGTEVKETTPETRIIDTDITQELCDILRQIDGAGEVSVMLSIHSSTTTIYQTDDSDNRQDTVIITDDNRVQTGLVQQVIYPKYRGAIIVCQGADNAQVRLNIMEAVSRITGLGMDKISVIKMK